MAVDAVVTKVEGFGYGGRRVFNGEVIRMLGLPNDGKLVTLGYLTRYDQSAHEHSDEVEANGRKFISAHHHQSFIRMMADEEYVEAQRLDIFKTDQRQLEATAIEGAGLRVREQQGPPQVSLSDTNLAQMKSCPIDGCGERVKASDMREHVEAHEADVKPVTEAAAKPAAKRPASKATAKPAAKKPAARRTTAASR